MLSLILIYSIIAIFAHACNGNVIFKWPPFCRERDITLWESGIVDKNTMYDRNICRRRIFMSQTALLTVVIHHVREQWNNRAKKLRCKCRNIHL